MYTIGDFLISVKNAYRAHKKSVSYPRSNSVVALGKILAKEGYVTSVKEAEVEGRKTVEIELKYSGRIPAVTDIKLISKPSVHRYAGKNGLKTVARHGIGILSTNMGMMTTRDAMKNGVGGELICQIF